MFLGVIPVDGNRWHNLFAPLLIDCLEIIVVNAHALNTIATAHKIALNKSLQFFLVVEEVKDESSDDDKKVMNEDKESEEVVVKEAIEETSEEDEKAD